MTRIHHVGVTVADMERALRFYRDLLGLAVLERGVAEGAWIDDVIGIDGTVLETADLDAGGGRILELIAYPGATAEGVADVPTSQPGAMHVAVVVPSVPEAIARIAAAGGRAVSRRPVTLDAPGSPWWDGHTVAYTRDPDGAVVELIGERA